MTDLRTLNESGDVPALLCALLANFHAAGWATGTGGGICGPADEDHLWVAPTAVHKELVRPEDLFKISIDSGVVAAGPDDKTPSECAPIFREICGQRGASSVLHSHALSAVLAGDLAQDGALQISGFEMLKGVGIANSQSMTIPLLVNTEREHQLTDAVAEALRDPRFEQASAILVRDHGCYVWGESVMQTKQRAEVYHWLFEGVVARAASGRS